MPLLCLLRDTWPGLPGGPYPIQLEIGHSTSRNSDNFFGSLGGEILLDGDNVGDDDAEVAEVATEDVAEAGSSCT